MNREGACTWTTDAFEQVLEKLNASGFGSGMLYCSGIAGDYATRSFITNLYDGSLMNDEKTAYTMNSDANQKAFTKIKEWVDKGWMLNGADSTGAGCGGRIRGGQSVLLPAVEPATGYQQRGGPSGKWCGRGCYAIPVRGR